jgi:hypothetical protein
MIYVGASNGEVQRRLEWGVVWEGAAALTLAVW